METTLDRVWPLLVVLLLLLAQLVSTQTVAQAQQHASAAPAME